ncbi:MAG: AsmA family protein, partial [Desulfobacterales bacterium]|nr:AsmA family protein [Desulfobacterales bacterium]
MRIPKIALFVLVGLVLLTAAALGALWLVDPAVFRDQLETRASQAFGRHFRIEGDIGLERSLRPRIILHGITIANTDWAAAEHFARADEVAVQVALVPLLFGEMQVLDVRFAGMELFTEIRPDGANNFTFAGEGDREAPQRLPSIERLRIRDAVIQHRLARGKIDRYEITQAQLWNVPGKPERIEAEGSAKGMAFRIQFTADSAAELSGPQNPWSVHLKMQGPDMTLTFDGQMAQAFTWDRLEGRLVVRGQQVDFLEKLFETETPLTGPFEFAAALQSSRGLYRLTDLAAQAEGPYGQPRIAITEGVASGGAVAPLSIVLQGKLDETPLKFRFDSERLPALAATQAPWPLAATLQLAETTLDLRGTMTTESSGAKRLALDGRLQGDSLETLARVVNRDFPAAGPYAFAFHADIGDQGYALDKLAGEIKGLEGWDTLKLHDGRAALNTNGSINAAIEAGVNDVPVSLSLATGPQTTEASDRNTWPLQVQAAVPGNEMTAEGAIVVAGERHGLKLTTQIRGERLDTLGNLMGTTLPNIGPYDLKADIESGGGVHRLQNLQVQLGANRASGALQWRDQAPRPLLTGRLAANRLRLKALPSPAAQPAGRAGRRIDLGGFQAFDARLAVVIEELADAPIPV